ncbi:MAG: S1 RNA-binding domain-containing protein [Pirellulales bacterium]|nr:S1 RNA-binding domain-containing protein [Pirellulales bacterium]
MSNDENDRPRRKILIGSQRDAAAYRPRPKRDDIPVIDPDAPPPAEDVPSASLAPEALPLEAETLQPVQPYPEPVFEIPATAVPETVAPPQSIELQTPRVAAPQEEPLPGPASRLEPATELEQFEEIEQQMAALPESLPSELPQPELPAGGKRFPPPNIRARLSPDLEQEFQAALGNESLDALIEAGQAVTQQEPLESESKHSARVLMIRRDDVFVELGGREQGILPLSGFEQPPMPGTMLDVVVSRFNREDGLYELALPGTAANIGDWSDLEEGMLVDARITGHNSGGLECEVNHIRGFIPVSQISLYRVENIEQFVGEKFTCLVTEANPQRRNLVLSRRAVLEREKQQAREALLDSLAPGQVREGVVRKLMDFGAFVDLGGVDGLLHVSQLAWGRVNHPKEVLHEGQHIKVRVDKVDRENNRISLAYRDMMENPWTGVEQKYPINTAVRGKVTKLMEFGAFVELEPGVEGLVHISELSNKRVWRTSDVVNPGDEVDVMVLAMDPAAQRISLSMKALMAEPAAEKKEEGEPQLPEPAVKAKPRREPDKPLKGGLGRAGGGDRFGLKW